MGHIDTFSGGEGGGAGTPQTSFVLKLHPVPTVQPSSSSVTVHSLALAAWQMASASAKFLFAEHCQSGPSSDPPHTEQPACLVQGLWSSPSTAIGTGPWSKQQRTWCGLWVRGEHVHMLHARDGRRCGQRAHRVPLVRIPEPCRLVGALAWVPAPDWPCLRRRRGCGWRQRGRQRISGGAPSQPRREQQQRCGTSRLQSTMGAARSRGTGGAHYLALKTEERTSRSCFWGLGPPTKEGTVVVFGEKHTEHVSATVSYIKTQK